jgi:hypothetical protein
MPSYRVKCFVRILVSIYASCHESQDLNRSRLEEEIKISEKMFPNKSNPRIDKLEYACPAQLSMVSNLLFARLIARF